MKVFCRLTKVGEKYFEKSDEFVVRCFFYERSDKFVIVLLCACVQPAFSESIGLRVYALMTDLLKMNIKQPLG